MVDGYAGGDGDGAVGLGVDFRFSGLGEFVLDFADDLLEQVLHSDEALGAAVFVDDDSHLDGFFLNFLEEVVEAFGLGNEVGAVLFDVVEGQPLPVVSGKVFEEFDGVDDADDVVEVVLVHRDAVKAGFDDGLDGFRQGGVDFQGDHIEAGNHYLVGGGFVEFDDGLEHSPIAVVEGVEFGLGDFRGRRNGIVVRGVSVAVCRVGGRPPGSSAAAEQGQGGTGAGVSQGGTPLG